MNISDLVINNREQVSLEDIQLDEANKQTFSHLIKEHTYVDRLLEYGLPVNNKILLHGSSGCGKTMSANAIANALNKHILILNLSNVVCARIGETSQNIKQVFDKAAREKAVLFLDEFDQIGKARGAIIDTALLRRFQLKVSYEMPSNALLDNYYNQLLLRFPERMQQIERKYDISYAEAKDYLFTAIKSRLIEEFEQEEVLVSLT